MANVLSDREIANVAQQVGFRGQAAVTAVAVALAESDGDADVYNGICCWGLWQINARVHKNFSTRQLQIPIINAREAWRISGGGRNWQPWEVYTNGRYKRYLNRAKKAIAGGTGLEDTPGFGETPPLLQDPLAHFGAQIISFLQDIGTTIVSFVGGLILIALGVYLIAKDQGAI